MSLSERYDRFREFVAEHIPLEPITFSLRAMPVSMFMTAICAIMASRPNIAPQEIGPLVLDGLGIDPAKFDTPTHARFGLYCEYFAETARAMMR